MKNRTNVILAVVAVFIALAIGTYLWSKDKKKKANGTAGQRDQAVTDGDGGTIKVVPDALDPEKILKESCIGTVCPYLPETAQLQIALNAQLARSNSILSGAVTPKDDFEKDTKKRFDKLFVGGTLKLKFQTGSFKLDPLVVDGKFGKKTEQMLFIATGRTKASLNGLQLIFNKKNPNTNFYSLV